MNHATLLMTIIHESGQCGYQGGVVETAETFQRAGGDVRTDPAVTVKPVPEKPCP